MRKLDEKTIQIIEAFSWYGIIAIIGAYTLVSFQIYQPSHILPVFLNITGSMGVLVDAWKDGNKQPVVLNIIWILIAIITLVRGF